MAQYIEDSNFDSNLRLGDIIGGFSYIVPNFEDFVNKGNEFTLDIKNQQFFSVFTPCCSIEDQKITLVPLKKIKPEFLKNPFYMEDFTLLNRPIPPFKSIPPIVWDNYSEDENNTIRSKDVSYALFELFLYGPNPKIPTYNLKYKNNTEEIGSYMIDFRDTFTISSKKIQRGNTYQKILELSILSRGELRNKLSNFFNRIPDEDKRIL